MKQFLLVVLFLGEVSPTLAAVGSRGVTYYVKPSKTTECPGQPCETLNDYLDNMASELNRQKNVTMLFLNGNHSLDDGAQRPLIYTPIIRMIGENENVKVVASDLELNASAYHPKLLNNNVVTIESLVLINWKLLVSMAVYYPTPMMFNIVTTTMHNCWIDTSPATDTHLYIEQSILQGGQYNFRLNSTLVASRFENANMLIDGRDLQTENCTFFNTPVLAQYSQNILLSGITLFFYYYDFSNCFFLQ